MDSNQLGRRNLSPDAFRMILGRRYTRAKKTKAEAGAIGGSSKDQIDPCFKESTAARLSKEHAVSEPTVKRAAKFYEEVERTPELKRAVEEGRPVLQAKNVQEIHAALDLLPEPLRFYHGTADNI